MEAVVQFISNVGFPIAAFLLMYKEMQDTRKSHQEESDKWSEALNNNTRVLERLEGALKQ